MSLQKKICQWGKYFEKAIEILLIGIRYYFLDQCILSVPTENKKRYFQRVWKGNICIKWVNKFEFRLKTKKKR